MADEEFKWPTHSFGTVLLTEILMVHMKGVIRIEAIQ